MGLIFPFQAEFDIINPDAIFSEVFIASYGGKRKVYFHPKRAMMLMAILKVEDDGMMKEPGNYTFLFYKWNRVRVTRRKYESSV